MDNLSLKDSFQFRPAFRAVIPFEANAVDFIAVTFNHKVAAIKTMCAFAFITGNVAAINVF